EGVGTQTLDGAVHGRECRDDDDAGFWLRLLHELQDGGGIKAGDHVVENDDVIRLPTQGRLDLGRFADDVDEEFVAGEGGFDESADRGVVVDDRDAQVAGAIHAAAFDRLFRGSRVAFRGLVRLVLFARRSHVGLLYHRA